MSNKVYVSDEDKIKDILCLSLKRLDKEVKYISKSYNKNDDDANDLMADLYLKLGDKFLNPIQFNISMQKNMHTKMSYLKYKGNTKEPTIEDITYLEIPQGQITNFNLEIEKKVDITIRSDSFNPEKYREENNDEFIKEVTEDYNIFLEKIDNYTICINNKIPIPSKLMLNINSNKKYIARALDYLAKDKFSKKRSFWDRNFIQENSIDESMSFEEFVYSDRTKIMPSNNIGTPLKRLASFNSNIPLVISRLENVNYIEDLANISDDTCERYGYGLSKYKQEAIDFLDKKNIEYKTSTSIKRSNSQIIESFQNPELDILDNIDSKNRAAKISTFMKKNMKPQHQRVIHLLSADMDYKEISKRTGLKIDNIKQIVLRTRAKIVQYNAEVLENAN